jgi:photosystem II stability/assembly factor-like uncharacterized protein
MTTDRDLDLHLASWFDERTTSAPPADLLSRALGRVDKTRQRPRLLTAGAYARPWWGSNGAPLAAPVIIVVLTLLVVVLVVAGAQLVVPRLTVVLPAPTPGPSSTALPTSAPLATPLDTRPPAQSVQASVFGTAWDPIPFGDNVAWIRTNDAPGSPRGAAWPGLLYRTEDAGQTWRAVQPAGFSQPWANAFVDANTAYVKVGDGASIAFTHDGGASWTTTTLDAGAGIAPAFVFPDSMHGFVTFVDPALDSAPGGTGLLVFSTTDGGATWSGPVRSTQPHLADGSNKLESPIGPYLVESSGQAPGKPFQNDFYLSADGGGTWRKYTFPINSISSRNDLKVVDQLFAEPNGRLLVEFSASPSGRGGHPNGIYESTDDPAAWRLLYTESDGDGDVQFLSATTWILRSGAPNEILTTLDAGLTWSKVTSTTSVPYAVTPVFGSAHTAWFTIECRWIPDQPNCPRTQSPKLLFVTTDGGATWREVGA